MEACRRKKISDKVSGEKNPMYGKPSPQGSGSGWKGWYKNWFFRSLRELSYVINVIEKNKWTWFSAEKAEFAIKYVFFDNKIRTYFADFVVNEKKLVEVKPIKLHNSPLVLSKTKAAKEFCLKKSFEFEIIDPPMLEYFEISRLLQNNEIKFMEKYEKKFNGMYKETDNN
jgi:hypothetical protein